MEYCIMAESLRQDFAHPCISLSLMARQSLALPAPDHKLLTKKRNWSVLGEILMREYAVASANPLTPPPPGAETRARRAISLRDIA